MHLVQPRDVDGGQVDELDGALPVDHHVLGAQVLVQHLAPVQGLQALGELLDEVVKYFGESTEEEEEDEKPDFALAENKTSPLVIDLDGDGVETTSINDVYFDHNNDGLREKTAWVKSDDGLLVLDKNNDGIISNGNELFGSNTTLKNGLSASNGFEALSDYDDNADGVIDSNDALYSSIKIWQDIFLGHPIFIFIIKIDLGNCNIFTLF